MNKRRTGMRRRLSLYVIAGILAVAASFTLIFFNYFDRLYQERMDHDQLRYTGAAAANAATLLTNIRQNAYTLCCNETWPMRSQAKAVTRPRRRSA